MKCDACGNQTRFNWGNAEKVLCEACWKPEPVSNTAPSPEHNLVPDKNPPDTARTIHSLGAILIGCGLFCAGYFAFIYTTTVSANGQENMQVHNIGLLQNRQTGIIGGIGVAILGGVLLLHRPLNTDSA